MNFVDVTNLIEINIRDYFTGDSGAMRFCAANRLRGLRAETVVGTERLFASARRFRFVPQFRRTIIVGWHEVRLFRPALPERATAIATKSRRNAARALYGHEIRFICSSSARVARAGLPNPIMISIPRARTAAAAARDTVSRYFGRGGRRGACVFPPFPSPPPTSRVLPART